MKEIHWFRRDLRLEDNASLAAIASNESPILALYILEEDEDCPPGGASKWWLHHSLASLQQEIASRGGTLLLKRGRPDEILPKLVQEENATAVRWCRRYEPGNIRKDSSLKQLLESQGTTVYSTNSSLIFEPWNILNKEGRFFKVFTPFWRACLRKNVPPPVKLPKNATFSHWKSSGDDLAAWQLLPTGPDWSQGLKERWTPGEAGALEALETFLQESVYSYKKQRDFPAVDGTSSLSPYLHFGEIGPKSIWERTMEARSRCSNEDQHASIDCFLSEIGWREFSYNLLYNFPSLPEAPFQEKFSQFPWEDNAEMFKAWCQGKTGYPIVDAGMRQLWATGWMHNRVRMITASFLTKDLFISWQRGAAWFLDTLVDADLASNSAGWQWTAGCGADAAPYFRVFNPVTQSEKFDPEGLYIRTWVPELASLPNKYIHRPWEAPEEILRSSGIALGANYPLPIVDHNVARKEALEAFSAIGT